jgi:hypothetical protein
MQTTNKMKKEKTGTEDRRQKKRENKKEDKKKSKEGRGFEIMRKKIKQKKTMPILLLPICF